MRFMQLYFLAMGLVFGYIGLTWEPFWLPPNAPFDCPNGFVLFFSLLSFTAAAGVTALIRRWR